MKISDDFLWLIGIAAQFALVDLQPDPRAVGDKQITSLTFDRTIDDLIEGVGGGMALHENIVGDGGVELAEGGDVDRAAHQVGEDADKG